MRGQGSPVVTLAFLAALVVSALAITATSTAGDAGGARSQMIASVTTSDFRVVLTATKRGGGAAPTAAVSLATFRGEGTTFTRTGVRRLGGTYFWKVVTGPRAVCRLEIRTAGAGATFRPRALVQLLASPSLGCAGVSTLALTG